MIVRLKRIYGFFIDMITPYVILLIVSMSFMMTCIIFGININESIDSKVLNSIYISVLLVINVLYWTFKSEIFRGQTPFNKIFRLKFEYKKRWHLIIKNIIDLFTFTFSFVTVLLFNKSISEIILKMKCIDLDRDKEKDSYYSFEMLLIGLYTLSFFTGIFVFSSRIRSREEFLISDLKYSSIIDSEIGDIEKLSFRRINIIGYKIKDGKYIIKTYITNKEHQKYKVDIYMDSDINWFVSFLIDGTMYDEKMPIFSLDDFLIEKKTYITYFQENNKNLTEVSKFNTPRESICISRNLFEKYFEDSFDSEDIEFYYDMENKVYLVIQQLGKDENGERRIALLKTDGEILGVWEEKENRN